MSGRRKSPREKDLTSRYLSGGMDEDRIDKSQRFSNRNKTAQQEKILRTAMMRAEEQAGADIELLPVGEVVQVYSLYSEVEHEGKTWLCVVRKTLTKVLDTPVIVGDQVRFRDVSPPPTVPAPDSTEAPEPPPLEGVIEQLLPRRTVLTRSDSFKGIVQHPIVANAAQMLIVVSLREPDVRWGLVDRMIVAAQSGGLKPVVCLNKIDLARPGPDGSTTTSRDLTRACDVLSHYGSLGIPSIETSVDQQVGLDALRDVLRNQTTVLAGHSGVGKSSLIRAIQPQLDLRIGAISGYTGKGRHTTTSARRYKLDFGEGSADAGAVVDTPGVKLFGLWTVTRENLGDYFPDVAAGTAPPWRKESYERILDSLPQPESWETPRDRP